MLSRLHLDFKKGGSEKLYPLIQEGAEILKVVTKIKNGFEQ